MSLVVQEHPSCQQLDLPGDDVTPERSSRTSRAAGRRRTPRSLSRAFVPTPAGTPAWRPRTKAGAGSMALAAAGDLQRRGAFWGPAPRLHFDAFRERAALPAAAV